METFTVCVQTGPAGASADLENEERPEVGSDSAGTTRSDPHVETSGCERLTRSFRFNYMNITVSHEINPCFL